MRTELESGVLTVRLDRAEAAHARNQVMRDELASLWRAVVADRGVRAVILTGTGDRFFCAGMDLKEAGSPEDPVSRRDRMRRSRDIEQLAELPQPTIAAINGFALGGGLEMALACDIRLVADHAQIGLPEVTRGLVPGGGGTQRLPRLVGYARACELVLSGRRLTAAEAVEYGIALRVTPAADLPAAAVELARGIAGNPEPAVRYAKALLRRSQQVPVDVGADAELDALLTLLGEADAARRRSS
ncbi:enoyl-CoA hydratase-related protein [Streptosporangium sp. NPDC002544]|uniref:enoyl-CoA hydratase/isomerase family protein n=1 Tax=Streptosporangium sp. NPDC002544 TaxID=3154538 RepID=UPI00331E65A8